MRIPLIVVVLVAMRLSSANGGPPASYKDTVLADNPFAFYPLDESDNTKPVMDGAANNDTEHNSGVYVNNPKVGAPGAIDSDPRNTAASFIRANKQYIKLTNFGNFGSNMSSGFTVEYWLKTKDSFDHQAIFGTTKSPDMITDFLVDIAEKGKEGKLRLYGRDDNWHWFEIEFYPEGKNINIYDDHWHYIAHVYNPKAASEDDKFILYVDGLRQTLSIAQQLSAPQFSDFNHPVSLGACDSRGREKDFLEGSLDDVAFYLNPLTEAQIKTHYQAAGDELKKEE